MSSYSSVMSWTVMVPLPMGWRDVDLVTSHGHRIGSPRTNSLPSCIEKWTGLKSKSRISSIFASSSCRRPFRWDMQQQQATRSPNKAHPIDPHIIPTAAVDNGFVDCRDRVIIIDPGTARKSVTNSLSPAASRARRRARPGSVMFFISKTTTVDPAERASMDTTGSNWGAGVVKVVVLSGSITVIRSNIMPISCICLALTSVMSNDKVI